MASQAATAALADGIHFAWIGEDVVVLDVEKDEYLCLTGAGAMIKAAEEPGRVELADPALLQQLEVHGLTTQGVQPQRRRPLRAVASAPLFETAPLHASLLAGLNAAVSTAAFKGRGFASLIAMARARERTLDSTDINKAVRLASAFEAVRPWIPFEGDCLQRAFMLHHHLRANGVRADWVFGVRTWPFLAHCWIQVGDIVVGDSLERVSGFTPIVVI